MTAIGGFHKKARRPERFFNMVECALALAVVAIGVVSIVALFPVGLEASRDAIADSYTADAMDSFLSYFKGELQTPTGWTNYVTNNQIPPTKPYTTGLPANGIESDNWNQLNETPLIQNHTGHQGVFKVQIKSINNNTEFSGISRIWRSDITSGGNVYATGLNVEVSWPAQAPYDKRRRTLYYLDVFNPN